MYCNMQGGGTVRSVVSRSVIVEHISIPHRVQACMTAQYNEAGKHFTVLQHVVQGLGLRCA